MTTGNSGFLLCWPREVQSSIRVARESWGLLSSHCRAKDTSSSLVFSTQWSSPGATGISGLHYRLTRGVRPHLQGKQRTPLSSRAATRISWSPLSGLKGVKPPLQFAERTRDCSPGQTGKEGPHLAMTGASRGFSQGAVPGWGFSRDRLERLMLRLKLQYFGHLMQRVDSLEKTLMLGKDPSS